MAISDLDGVVCPECGADNRPKRIEIDSASTSVWWRLKCTGCSHRWWIEYSRYVPDVGMAVRVKLNIAAMAAGVDAHHPKAIKGRKI